PPAPYQFPTRRSSDLVKLSEEGSKAGAAPEELPGLIAAIRACPNLQLTGLMTMPPWNPDPETTRPYFRKLADLARTHQLPKLSIDRKSTRLNSSHQII